MAAFNGNLTIRQTAKTIPAGGDPTEVPISDTPETITVGVLRPASLLLQSRVKGSPATTTWFAFSDSSSDISGYRVLTNSGLDEKRSNLTLTYAMDDMATPPEYTALEEFVTEPNVMDNVFANGVSTTLSVTAWKDVGGVLNDVYIEGYVYHRDTGGTETLLTSFEDLVSTTSTKYTHSVSLVRRWQPGERLVSKYRFRNDGIPI